MTISEKNTLELEYGLVLCLMRHDFKYNYNTGEAVIINNSTGNEFTSDSYEDTESYLKDLEKSYGCISRCDQCGQTLPTWDCNMLEPGKHICCYFTDDYTGKVESREDRIYVIDGEGDLKYHTVLGTDLDLEIIRDNIYYIKGDSPVERLTRLISQFQTVLQTLPEEYGVGEVFTKINSYKYYEDAYVTVVSETHVSPDDGSQRWTFDTVESLEVFIANLDDLFEKDDCYFCCETGEFLGTKDNPSHRHVEWNGRHYSYGVCEKCENCNEEMPASEMVYIDGSYYCQDCADDRGYCSCERCEDFFFTEDMFECGYTLYCEDCYNEIDQKSYAIIKDYGDNDILWCNDNDETMGWELEIEGPSSANREKVASQINELVNSDDERICFSYDGSVQDGFEIKTHIHDTTNIWEIPNIEDAFTLIKSLGFYSEESMACGLHFHFGRNMFKKDCVEKLRAFFYYYYDDLVAYFRRGTMSRTFYRKFEDIDEGIPLSMRFDDSVIKHTRYNCINTNNRNTIEFRMPRGTTKYNVLKADGLFLIFLIKYMNITPWEEVLDIEKLETEVMKQDNLLAEHFKDRKSFLLTSKAKQIFAKNLVKEVK